VSRKSLGAGPGPGSRHPPQRTVKFQQEEKFMCRLQTKNTLLRAAICSVPIALFSSTALAQENAWAFDLSAYLWATDTGVTADTPFGEVNSDLSFSDALKDLDFAFMGTAEARNGPWGIIGDLLYFKLTSEGSPPGPVFSGVTVENEMTVLTGYLAYRVYETADVALDLGAGFRAFWADVDIDLSGNLSESFGQSKNWVDPIVAARLGVAFSDQWFGSLSLDGGGTSDTSNWQALATVGYSFNENWSVLGGWRYLEAEWDTDQGKSSLDFSGPIMGVTYGF